MQAERPQDMRIEAEGCAFVEGPVALPDGAVAFVDLVDACVRVTKDGETRVLAELPGAPNGMRLGPDAPKNAEQTLNGTKAYWWRRVSARIH